MSFIITKSIEELMNDPLVIISSYGDLTHKVEFNSIPTGMYDVMGKKIKVTRSGNGYSVSKREHSGQSWHIEPWMIKEICNEG